jgi:hypothetical protein
VPEVPNNKKHYRFSIPTTKNANHPHLPTGNALIYNGKRKEQYRANPADRSAWESWQCQSEKLKVESFPQPTFANTA